MLSKFIWCAIIVLPITMSAQSLGNDVAQITSTLENYFNGYIQRDGQLLEQAFDMEHGAMKVHTKSAKRTETVENNYFRDLIPKWASREKLSPEILEQSALEIQNIDVVDGKIGSAKMSMKVGETTYVDILSLQKINQVWKITNKIFIVQEN